MSEWIEGKNYRKKVLYTANDLGQNNTKVQFVEIESGNEVPPHYHKKQTEVYNVQKGRAILGIGDQEYLATEGDVLICKPEEIHSAKNENSKTFRLLVFKTNYEEDDTYWLDE